MINILINLCTHVQLNLLSDYDSTMFNVELILYVSKLWVLLRLSNSATSYELVTLDLQLYNIYDYI